MPHDSPLNRHPIEMWAERPTVVVRSHVARPELVIHYDGSRPPTELFELLASTGWRPPVPTPPPAAAIVWSRGDSRDEARHRIRPFAATGTATRTGSPADDGSAVARATTDALRLGCNIEGAARVRVSALVGPDAADRAVELGAELGARVSIEPAIERQVVRYRGQVTEQELPLVRVVLELDSLHGSEAVAALTSFARTRPVLERLDDATRPPIRSAR